MNESSFSPREPKPMRKGSAPIWVRLLLGAAVGFALSLLTISILPDGASVGDVSPTQILAGAIGLIALIIGLIVLAMSFSKTMYNSENWTAESDANEHQQIAPQLRISALAMLAMGVEFFALAAPVEPTRALPIIAIIISSLAVQLGTSWSIWRKSDELQRMVMLESSAISLGIILVLVTIWAPLQMYGLAQMNPLALILSITAACVLPTIWLSVRRGLTR